MNGAGDVRVKDSRDSAWYLCGEAMLPDGGVGVCRRNGSESGYPALLRLALRDRKWEVGEMARLGRRRPEAAAALRES